MAKKKAGPRRKKQDIEEVEVEIDDRVDVTEDDVPEVKSDGDDIEDELPKSKSKGKAKPASKKRGSKTRPAEEEDDEEVVETPLKKGKGRSTKSGKASPELIEEDIDSGEEVVKSQPSAKKGKGRPPKKTGKTSPESVEDEDLESGEGEEEIKSQPSAKKGKGRPKKSGKTSPESVDEDGENGEDAPVSKRGKPKKAGNVSPELNEEGEEEEEEEDASSSRKGRGRPKSGPKSKTDKRKAANTPKGPSAKRGKPTSSKKPDEDSDEEEEEKEYEVDRILDVHFLTSGKREFLIKWKGYSKDDSTWEPENHLDCKELLEAFMAKVEYDDVSRPRRLSRRPSTVKATRISEARSVDLLNRVKDGRIDKTVKRSSVSSTRSSSKVQSIGRFNQQNGRVLTSVSENVIVRHNKQRTTKRGILRAAVLSCGMVVSLSAALMYSSNASLSWDNISLQAQELITGLKDKLEVYYQHL